MVTCLAMDLDSSDANLVKSTDNKQGDEIVANVDTNDCSTDGEKVQNGVKNNDINIESNKTITDVVDTKLNDSEAGEPTKSLVANGESKCGEGEDKAVDVKDKSEEVQCDKKTNAVIELGSEKDAESEKVQENDNIESEKESTKQIVEDLKETEKERESGDKIESDEPKESDKELGVDSSAEILESPSINEKAATSESKEPKQLIRVVSMSTLFNTAPPAVETERKNTPMEADSSISPPEKSEADVKAMSRESNDEPSAKRRKLSADSVSNGGTKKLADVVALVDTDDEDADDPGSSDEPKLPTSENEVPAEKAVSQEKDAQSGMEEANDVSKSLESDPVMDPTELPALKKMRRGILANLTRSDLEELMVQKLCECVSERSDVGELRRRAQALEAEVEKWRERAMTYHKQVRELDLVMKRFINECERQAKDKSQLVTPFRTTRSVGLQVAFGTATKRSKSSSVTSPILSSLAKTPEPSAKVQKTYVGQTANKSSPAPANKPPKPIAPKTSDAGSKVIDLTDEDETVPKKTPPNNSNIVPGKQVTLINTVPQQGNKPLTYLVPAQGQRHVLIATPAAPRFSPPPLVIQGSGAANRPAIIHRALRHPAPLPPCPTNQTNQPHWKAKPPRPSLKISKVATGIVLSWDLTVSSEHESIASYQLFAYQEGSAPPTNLLWKKVGDVKALPLPMACTLTHFVPGHKYHFAVRAVDIHMRIGPFSFPGTILLVK